MAKLSMGGNVTMSDGRKPTTDKAPDEPRICRLCIHVRLPARFPPWTEGDLVCGHAKSKMAPNIITGESPLNKCIDMRSAYGGCGYDGKLFEAKQTLKPAATIKAEQIPDGSITFEKVMSGRIIAERGRGAGYTVEIRKSLAERIAYWWRWWFD